MDCPVCALRSLAEGAEKPKAVKMRKRAVNEIFAAKGIIGLAMADITPEVEWWHCGSCGLVLMRVKR